MEGLATLQVAVPQAPTTSIEEIEVKDALVAAAEARGLRVLPDQKAAITRMELDRRLERRRKQDDCPRGEVLELEVKIADMRREVLEIEERLKPKPVHPPKVAKRKKHSPVTPAQPRSYWSCTEAEWQARQALKVRQRELPKLIYAAEKELEEASRVSKPESHLRGLIHCRKHFGEEPQLFDLRLQGLLPQLQGDELFVAAFLEAPGRLGVCFCSNQSEYEIALSRSMDEAVIFCALDPRKAL